MKKKLTQGQHIRNIIIFIVLVINLGWIGFGLDTRIESSPQDSPGMLLWILAPFAVSFLLRGFAGDGWKDLGIKLNLKGNLKWYIISIFIYPACVFFIILLGRVMGVLNISVDKFRLFTSGFLPLLIAQIFQNIFEEFGFRGYLAPKLSNLKINTFFAHIIVGLTWGVWHLPYLRSITPYTSENLITLIPRFLIGAIAASIIYGEIRLRTKSVWPAVIMQTVGGTVIGGIILNNIIQINTLKFLFNPVLEGGLMIILFGIIGVVLHLKKTSFFTD